MNAHRRHLRPARPFRAQPRFSADEWAAIIAASERAGLTPASFVGEAAVRAAGRGPDLGLLIEDRVGMTELMTARVELRRVGTNLNQAVTALNTGKPAADTVVRLSQAIDRTVARVDAAVQQLVRKIP